MYTYTKYSTNIKQKTTSKKNSKYLNVYIKENFYFIKTSQTLETTFCF